MIENLKDSSQNQKRYKMILKFAILKCPEFKKSYMNFFFLNGCAHRQFFSCDHLQKYFLLSNGLWWEQFDLFYHGKPQQVYFKFYKVLKYRSYVFPLLSVEPLKLKKEQIIWVNLSWWQISVISSIEYTSLKQIKMCFCMILSTLLDNCSKRNCYGEMRESSPEFPAIMSS